MTKQEAMHLVHGQIVFHKKLRNSDKTPLRARVSGKCVLWKTRPDEFMVPMKYGLYDNLKLTEINMNDWCLHEEEALA